MGHDERVAVALTPYSLNFLSLAYTLALGQHIKTDKSIKHTLSSKTLGSIVLSVAWLTTEL